MEKVKKAIVLVYLAVFLFDLAMFAFTRDAYYGIWAILLSLAVRVSGSIEIKRKGER